MSPQTYGEADSTAAHMVLQPNPEVIMQRMGEQVMLLHLRTNHFYELNRTAARLWELLNEGNNRPQIHAQLLNEFDVDSADLAAEVEVVLMSLREKDLVREHAGS